MIDHTHDPSLRSWVESANQPGAGFPIQSLPFATFRKRDEADARLGVAIGDQVLDVTEAFDIHSMRTLMSMDRQQRTELRRRISKYLERGSSADETFLSPMDSVGLLLPCEIRDYTDFYASIHHATNVGRIFRPDHPLLPNYKWVPVGYHGRASSVVVSGTPIRRPWGQISEGPAGPPVYAPTRRLDYELELGAFAGPGNEMGESIPANQAADHLVGVCLLNDWSARDVQAWEYQPLGPFLSKSFATSISPWVVTMEALEPFRVTGDLRPASDPAPLPHLTIQEPAAFDISMEVWLKTARMQTPVRLSRGNFASMYWTLAQMVAHHTSNGCPLRGGSLIGSGTVSGPERENRGCLLEITRNGAELLELPNGELRGYLEDGDEVILRGWCEAPGFRRIGLGECRGVVLAARAG
jgi:fumarylacetoacetase